MYPLNASAPWAREQWYVAGTGVEIGRAIKARTILDEPLVFFRTEAGAPVALWGLCPHRLMPFELGSLAGDELVCGYHGFRFDTSGACVAIPTADTIPTRCRVRSYPLVERGPFVWIWMGEGAADVALLPDAADIGLGDEPGVWRADPLAPMHLKARAQLLIDNLLDLSHLAFVHSRTVPGEAIPLVKATVEEDAAGRLCVARAIPDGPGGPTMQFLMPDAGDRVWTELTAVVYNPSLINTYGPWAWNVHPDGSKGASIGRMNFVHAVTPETPHSTHYFGAQTRDFRQDDDGLSAIFVQQNIAVRSEDIDALEAIERVADRYGDLRREISILPDAGALRARRRLADLIAAEQGRRSAAA